MKLPDIDLKVAFTSLDVVPNVAQAIESAKQLAHRLRIGHAATRIERRKIDYWHGFIPLPENHVSNASERQLEQLGFQQIHNKWYRTENGPFEQNPYYQFRLKLLRQGIEGVPLQLEATGICLAVHEHMFTINLRLISLHLEDRKTVIGPFVGDLFETSDSWLPFHELEERTTVGGPLAHIRMIEFLAALKREAIPALAIRDPSNYLEHGDVFALLDTMNVATDEFGTLWESLFGEQDMPDINDIHSAIPNLKGPVGSENRIAQLEQFLAAHNVATPDIDAMLERGR